MGEAGISVGCRGGVAGGLGREFVAFTFDWGAREQVTGR